jgi:lipoprotein-anchoring transpeptidase ErfK/SrfK
MLGTAALGQTPSRTSDRRGRAERRIQPRPITVDPAEIANPSQPDIAPGATGSAVLRAQILLDRAHFSCGELDGNYKTNLEKTVAAWQAERKLPATGTIDAATWAALNADTAPVLAPYTITPDDQRGPFAEVPPDMLAQADLPYLGYASPLEGLAERFHSSPAVLRSLNPGADFRNPGQEIQVPNVLTMPPGEAANVVVSKSESSVRAYDAAGRLIAFYVATSGSEHDPLPIGDWKILGVKRDPTFHYNAELFWDARDKNARAVIQPGPNNPVGLVWIDLSKEHYGIHGTPDPSRIGHVRSHGCIRLTNWDALELAAMVKPNTPALLRE